ncbi:MAG: Lar family restriction alleviation protein, partial [Kiritimatiellae bacterium]|nr:Lar family restriction alleviation protein [Kiritimatiellia bacterium]
MKLKPCPFCGSTFVEMDADARPFFFVCRHCQSSGPMGPSWNAAADAWNRRACRSSAMGDTSLTGLTGFSSQRNLVNPVNHVSGNLSGPTAEC